MMFAAVAQQHKDGGGRARTKKKGVRGLRKKNQSH